MELPMLTDVVATTRILIVDDDQANIHALDRLLKHAGYAIRISVTDARQVISRFSRINPDIILLDLHREPLSGAELIKELKETVGEEALPPIIVLTADTSPRGKNEALAAGATDFLAKPIDVGEVLLRIRNHVRTRALHQQCQVLNQGLEDLVEQRTADLQRRTQELEQSMKDLQEAQQQVLQQERMRALGTMAGGIAHDINNALTIITGYGDCW